MTRAVVARGADWGAAALNDGWGPDTPDEIVTQLSRLVVDRFHELADEVGANDTWWAPTTSEVQAEVYGQDTDEHSKWDKVHPLPKGITYANLREQAQQEVWDAFVEWDEDRPADSPMAQRVKEILDA